MGVACLNLLIRICFRFCNGLAQGDWNSLSDLLGKVIKIEDREEVPEKEFAGNEVMSVWC